MKMSRDFPVSIFSSQNSIENVLYSRDIKSMSSLVLIIIFGLGMAYFATQNVGTVHLIVANYLLSGIPMYVVVIFSLLLGILVSWILSMVDVISAAFTVRGKDNELKKALKTVDTLEGKVHDLEIENEQLKKGTDKQKSPRTEKERMPNFVERITHNFA